MRAEKMINNSTHTCNYCNETGDDWYSKADVLAEFPNIYEAMETRLDYSPLSENATFCNVECCFKYLEKKYEELLDEEELREIAESEQ